MTLNELLGKTDSLLPRTNLMSKPALERIGPDGNYISNQDDHITT
jgi:hypothetical protein